MRLSQLDNVIYLFEYFWNVSIILINNYFSKLLQNTYYINTYVLLLFVLLSNNPYRKQLSKYKRITNFAHKYDIFDKILNGYIKGRSTTRAIFQSLEEITYKCIKSERICNLCLYGFNKSVWLRSSSVIIVETGTYGL